MTAVALFSMWLSHFLVDFMIGIFSVYKTIASLDLAIAGAIAFFSAMIGEGMQIFSGALSDCGYRRWMLAGGLAAVCASILIAFTDSYPLIFLCVFITYIGSGCFHPAAAGYVSSLGTRRRAFFMTIFASGGAIGLAISQIGFYTLYRSLGSSLWLVALPPIAVGIWLLFQRDSAPPIREKLDWKRFTQIFSLFGRSDLRLLYLTLVCNQALFWGVIFLLPDLLLGRGQPEWLCYGGGHFALIFGAGCAMLPGGLLADRLSARRVMIAAMLCSLIFLYSLLYFAPAGQWTLIIWLFCLGASLGVVAPVGLAYGTQLYPERPGTVAAFLMGLVWCLAESAGPGGAGLLAHLIGGAEGPAYALAWIGAINFAGLFCIQRVKAEEQAVSEVVVD